MHINHFTYLLKLAYKNITRNKLRSFFIAFSVGISVTLAIWVMSIFDGMNQQIIDAIVNCNVGHYQLQEKKFGQQDDPINPLPLDQNLLKQLQALPILGVSPEMVIEGFINDPEGSEAVQLIGIMPQLHPQVMPIKSNLVEGHYLNEDDDGVLIGENLKLKFKFNIGENIVINYQDSNGDLRSEILKIKGIYKLNGAGFERKTLYLNHKTLAKLFGKEGFHRYVIKSKHENIKDEISKITPSDFIFKTWHHINPEMSVVIEFHEGTVRFFLLIVGICISVTILTPISMLWQERIKEFETLHIIGIRRNILWKIGIAEAMILSFISLCLAMFIVAIVIGPFVTGGLDLSSLRADALNVERAGIVLPYIIYPLLNLKQFFVSCFFVLVTVYVSYFFAIRKTLKQIRFQ